MSENKKVKVYKYKNIAAAMAVVLLAVVAVSTAVGGSADKDSKTVKKSDSSSSVSDSESQDSKSAYKAQKLTKNYEYQTVRNDEQLGSGRLVLVSTDHPFTGAVENTDGVYTYLFDDSGNQIMYATSTQLSGDSGALESFRKMGMAFCEQTNLNTVMVSKLLDSSDNTSESATGFCVDLQLYDSVQGTYPEFTGEDEYAWFAENCSDYGYILRYSADKAEATGNEGEANHFRYVGEPYSQYMAENDLCLEEFLEDVKRYTFESPLSYLTEDGTGYAVYYVEAETTGSTTNIPLPLNDENLRYTYDISGNNVDGYVICVNLTDEVVSADDNSTADESSSADVTED
jgi:D-alanyl-D-alanine carboxypeptidase